MSLSRHWAALKDNRRRQPRPFRFRRRAASETWRGGADSRSSPSALGSLSIFRHLLLLSTHQNTTILIFGELFCIFPFPLSLQTWLVQASNLQSLDRCCICSPVGHVVREEGDFVVTTAVPLLLFRSFYNFLAKIFPSS